jgi:serine/threonine protein kinase
LSRDVVGEARARVGSLLNDKWTLERLLGAGGMGAVYAARHRNGARAAVKVLHRFLSKHRDVRGRFLREGYAANRVDRPGAVKVLDDHVVVGGPDDGTAYLVMELLVGQSLEAYVAGGGEVTERQFLLVADAVLDVLDAAHAKGVVHRDIKPENLFIARDESGVERIKVLDFGLARLLEGQSTTTHGVAIGTPSYMSPEQAAGRNDEVDGRTDLFALASSGFRLITGRKLHEGSGAVDLTAKMAVRPAPGIRTIAPAVSEPFARVIDRALQFRREDRYASAGAMRSDVQKALRDLGAWTHGAATPGAPAGEKSIELSASDFEPSELGFEPNVSHVELSAADFEPSAAPPPATVALPTVALPVVALPIVALPIVALPIVANQIPPTVRDFPQPLPAEAQARPLESRNAPAIPPLQLHARSLTPIPAQRGILLPAAIVATVLAAGAVVAYVILAPSGRPDPASPEPREPEVTMHHADDETPVSGVVEPNAASNAITDASLPRSGFLPARVPMKPGDPSLKPPRRPKH